MNNLTGISCGLIPRQNYAFIKCVIRRIPSTPYGPTLRNFPRVETINNVNESAIQVSSTWDEALQNTVNDDRIIRTFFLVSTLTIRTVYGTVERELMIRFVFRVLFTYLQLKYEAQLWEWKVGPYLGCLRAGGRRGSSLG